ncbi:hypothetical protein ACFLXB_04090 [Chloroflexota bacterium]
MTFSLSNFLVAAILFFFIFMTGRMVKQKGMPYPVMLVALHKLIALGAGIYFGWKISTAGPLSTLEIVLVILTILFFALNVVTGSIFSRNKPVADWVSLSNRIVPYLAILSSLYLFNLLDM